MSHFQKCVIYTCTQLQARSITHDMYKKIYFMLGLHIGIKKNDLSLFYAAEHMVYDILKFSIFCLSKNKVELI